MGAPEADGVVAEVVHQLLKFRPVQKSRQQRWSRAQHSRNATDSPCAAVRARYSDTTGAPCPQRRTSTARRNGRVRGETGTFCRLHSCLRTVGRDCCCSTLQRKQSVPWKKRCRPSESRRWDWESTVNRVPNGSARNRSAITALQSRNANNDASICLRVSSLERSKTSWTNGRCCAPDQS